MRTYFLLPIFFVYCFFTANSLRAQIAPAPKPMLRPHEQLKLRLKGPKVAAHQGEIFGNGWMNTIGAFENALKSGADIIEMDLRISKDGVPIVYHDAEFDSNNHCSGKVSDHTAADIKANCRFLWSRNEVSNNQTPPFFEDVLRWANRRVVINAEFKDVAVIVPTLKIVKNFSAHDWVYFQIKGDPFRYETARRADPDVALLVRPKTINDLEQWLKIDDPALLVFELNENTTKGKIIQALKEHGKITTHNAWEFSSTYEFFDDSCDEVFQRGIDIAVTNQPRACAKEKKRRNPGPRH